MGKTSQSREENQQNQPTYDTEVGIRTRATLVGGEFSQHYATTALQSFKNMKLANVKANHVLVKTLIVEKSDI